MAVRPAAAYHGRVGDWVNEIREARDAGDRVVLVAATPGRAERTMELLADYDVQARAVTDTEALERAAVLVTTGFLSQASTCRPAASGSLRKPICSKKSAGRTSGAARRAAHFFQTSAT